MASSPIDLYVLAFRPKKSTNSPFVPAFWSAMNPTAPLPSSTSVTSVVAPFFAMIRWPVFSRTPKT